MNIGYFPFDIFESIVLDNIDTISNVIIDAYNTNKPYEHVFDPLSSHIDRTALIFVIIALNVLSKCNANQGIVDTINEHSASIASLQEHCAKSLMHIFPCILLLYTHAKESEFPYICSVIHENMNNFIQLLKIELESDIATTSSDKQDEVIFAVHRAKISVLESVRIFSNGWNEYWLTFIEEPGLLLWSSDKYKLKGGFIVQFRDINSIETLPKDAVEYKGKNIMKITKGRKVYTLSFESYRELLQWKNIFIQVK